jgi:hypothetical protein
MRKTRTFTINDDLLTEIEGMKGRACTSQRVNELPRRALEERRERLEQEAAVFFATGREDSTRERQAYWKASRKAISR